METWHCGFCDKDINIKKERFKSQTISGHKKNCSKTPGSRWYKPPTDSGTPPAVTSPEPVPPTSPPKEEVEGSSGTTHIDTSTLQEFAKPPVPEESTESGQQIPGDVIKEWIELGMSINFDLASAYATSKKLPAPKQLPMSSATAKWIAGLISKEVGPVESNWVVIIAALAPYALAPWGPLLLHKEAGPSNSTPAST